MTYNEGVMKPYVMKSDGRIRRFLEKEISRLASSGRGAAAVEFALMATVIAAMLTGIANYGMAQFDRMELESAARAGAQMALKDKDDTSAIQNAVVNATNLSITTNNVTPTESYACNDGTSVNASTDSCADGDPIQYFMTVDVSETFTLLILGTTINLSASAKVRTK